MERRQGFKDDSIVLRVWDTQLTVCSSSYFYSGYSRSLCVFGAAATCHPVRVRGQLSVVDCAKSVIYPWHFN